MFHWISFLPTLGLPTNFSLRLQSLQFFLAMSPYEFYIYKSANTVTLLTVSHFGEHKRLHLECSKIYYYIISLRVIIKAIFTSLFPKHFDSTAFGLDNQRYSIGTPLVLSVVSSLTTSFTLPLVAVCCITTRVIQSRQGMPLLLNCISCCVRSERNLERRGLVLRAIIKAIFTSLFPKQFNIVKVESEDLSAPGSLRGDRARWSSVILKCGPGTCPFARSWGYPGIATIP